MDDAGGVLRFRHRVFGVHDRRRRGGSRRFRVGRRRCSGPTASASATAWPISGRTGTGRSTTSKSGGSIPNGWTRPSSTGRSIRGCATAGTNGAMGWARRSAADTECAMRVADADPGRGQQPDPKAARGDSRDRWEAAVDRLPHALGGWRPQRRRRCAQQRHRRDREPICS